MSTTNSTVQVPCRKQGIFEQANWSARILTIDEANGTIAISRKNHPHVVFHHALEVRKVQMWPHFSPEHIVGNFGSLKAQLALRIVGVEISPSRMHAGSTDDAAAIVQRHRSAFLTSPAAGDAAEAEESSSDAEELPLSPTRDSELMGSPTFKVAKGRKVYWMIRFESLVNFEATVLALMSMKRADGQPLKPFTTSNVLGDFERIKRTYNAQVHTAEGTKAAAKKPVK